MSLFDYRASGQLAHEDWSFDALVMAAYRRADTVNALRLRQAFPSIVDELEERYRTPGGLVRGEAANG